MTAFKIDVTDGPVIAALNQLAASCADMTPAMRAIAGVLERQTEDNFAAQSGPLGKWPALAQSTIENRVGRLASNTKGGWRKDGRLSKSMANRATGIKILQDKGRLIASVTPFWSDTEAGIGSNAIYAAIHQLGGMAGRAHRVTIPARPYLPMFPDGRLQAGLEDDVLAEIQRHFIGE
jgi:phage gpG-like protein